MKSEKAEMREQACSQIHCNIIVRGHMKGINLRKKLLTDATVVPNHFMV